MAIGFGRLNDTLYVIQRTRCDTDTVIEMGVEPDTPTSFTSVWPDEARQPIVDDAVTCSRPFAGFHWKRYQTLQTSVYLPEVT